MTTTLFVLDVDDFRRLAKAAAQTDDIDVVKRGPYFQLSTDGPIEISRAATGCRNAVWFSAVAAIRHGRIGQWDRDVLRIEPVAPHEGVPHGG